METSALIEALAATSLGDDEFAAAAQAVRAMVQRIALADQLAAEVVAAQHYLPCGAVQSAVRYVSFYAPDAVAA